MESEELFIFQEGNIWFGNNLLRRIEGPIFHGLNSGDSPSHRISTRSRAVEDIEVARISAKSTCHNDFIGDDINGDYISNCIRVDVDVFKHSNAGKEENCGSSGDTLHPALARIGNRCTNNRRTNDSDGHVWWTFCLYDSLDRTLSEDICVRITTKNRFGLSLEFKRWYFHKIIHEHACILLCVVDLLLYPSSFVTIHIAG